MLFARLMTLQWVMSERLWRPPFELTSRTLLFRSMALRHICWRFFFSCAFCECFRATTCFTCCAVKVSMWWWWWWWWWLWLLLLLLLLSTRCRLIYGNDKYTKEKAWEFCAIVFLVNFKCRKYILVRHLFRLMEEFEFQILDSCLHSPKSCHRVLLYRSLRPLNAALNCEYYDKQTCWKWERKLF